MMYNKREDRDKRSQEQCITVRGNTTLVMKDRTVTLSPSIGKQRSAIQ